jgi:DNA-directed RNA polymerase subunit RPC12/RpoP
MRRSRRGIGERLRYAAAYRCEQCRERVRVSYLDYLRGARYAACPKCGWYDLAMRARRDRVDKMNRNPLRLLQRLFGARLYHCLHCRLQFYDIRRLRGGKRERTEAAHRMVGSE